MTSPRPTPLRVECDPELLVYWRTFPAPSNERLAVEIIETLQRDRGDTADLLREALRDLTPKPNRYMGDLIDRIETLLARLEGK